MRKSVLIIFLMLPVTVFMLSCHVGTSGSWKNDHIDAVERNKIATLNDRLFKAITTDDIEGVKKLMFSGLVSILGKKTDTIVHAVSGLHATSYSVLDEYYTKNSTTDIANNLLSSNGNANDYIVQYQALNKDMYLSMLVSRDLPVNFLIFAVYGKHDDAWKLNILYVGQYNIAGKTAPDYYNEALTEYTKGNIINAANLMGTASQLVNPANNHFKYKTDAEMSNFYSKVLNEGNSKYQFPLTVKQVEKAPQIFTIIPELINQDGYKGVCPMVTYLTTINLKDTIALKKQNMALQKVIGQVFKGIDQQKFIIYRVTDLFPNGNHPDRYYKFLQKLE